MATRSRKQARRGFGQVRKLPSGMWQVRFTGPDLERHAAPTTFAARIDAEAWLVEERRLIERSKADPSQPWLPPKVRKAVATAQAQTEAVRAANATFKVYAERW